MSDERDYHIAHSPFEDGPAITHLDEMFGDVYEHPEFYGHGGDAESRARDRAAARVLVRLRHKPDSTPVTVYRAAPRGVTTLRSGDWVSTVQAYAEQHALHSSDAAQDWPVYAATVPAGRVLTGGSDILEWGYFGPPVPLHVVRQGGRDAETIGQMRRRLQGRKRTRVLSSHRTAPHRHVHR
jgi:hypothetical protein